MANTVLTPNIILREIYAIMHQVSNFIMKTNRQYDPRFAQTGAKIGQSLDIRLPAKFTTRDGNQMSTQAYTERKVTLPLATIKGVDLNFGQEELTFSLDDFSDRVLRPAVSQLVSTVEYDAFSMIKKVPNYAGATNDQLDYTWFQTGGQYMTENLAPRSDRTACLNPKSVVQFNTDVKGLFQASSNIREQYREGMMGRTGGYDVYENTLLPTHTPGSESGTFETDYSGTPGGFDGGGSDNKYPTGDAFELDVTATSWDLKEGDIITIDGIKEVHPETKQSYGYDKRFVVAEDAAGTTSGSIPILPFPITSGAYQNVSGTIGNDLEITLLGGGGSAFGQNLQFHKDAFAFVTADLEDPSQYGAWGARQEMEGLSMRIWRQGDIANGNFPCRIDIAYGYVPVYPEWAVRNINQL